MKIVLFFACRTESEPVVARSRFCAVTIAFIFSQHVFLHAKHPFLHWFGPHGGTTPFQLL